MEEDEKIGDDYEVEGHVVINTDQLPENSPTERDSSVLELGVLNRVSLDSLCNKRIKPDLDRDWIKTPKKKRLEWWASLDREALRKDHRTNNKQPREWWKEEFCDELSKKTKSKLGPEPKPERKRKPSRTSIDRWIDSFSGELKNDVPKSGGGGISSTPSMRGTICYIAPECGGGIGGVGGAQPPPSDKCDVYSFGVLLLVVVSGRRPLQVAGSPLSEFERANLISWARQLALSGRLLDLVDPNVRALDRERAFLCVTVALLCLQRSPSKRPSMKEVVEMLSGRCEPPSLPFEFSPSPPCNFPFKSRRRSQ